MSTSAKSMPAQEHTSSVTTNSKKGPEKTLKNQHKSPSPLSASSNNNNNSTNSGGGGGLSSLAATLESGSSSYNNPLKRSSTSPISATNGSIPSIAETLNGQSMLSSLFPTTPSAADLNSVANLALMQQLHNSSLMTGLPTGLESLFRSSPSLPSPFAAPFSPAAAFGAYPGIPSPASLFGAMATAPSVSAAPTPPTSASINTASLSNGEPASKKPFDPLHSLRDQLTSSALNGNLLANGSTNLVNSLGSSQSNSSIASSGTKASSSSKTQNAANSSQGSGSNGIGMLNSTSNIVNGPASRGSPNTRTPTGVSTLNGSVSSSSSLSGSANSSSSSSAAKSSPPNNGNLMTSPALTSNGSAANGSATPGVNGNASSTSANSNSASPKSETDSIKSLIKSYRESAAFLNRSADELEKLLNGSTT
ncbi:uncharacterized protein LOC142353747 isoform X2 [Convolutriloba macropyga]|uniref:uncharacterized protein LOC142353747 isoform X2 n=1 Tax=Convolutriloba macropyga TaxID=536237 RepID=UPI003F523385